MNSKSFVGKLADELSDNSETMNSQQLASALNAAGCKTVRGDFYKGMRGTDKLKSASFAEAMNNGKVSTAKNISEVFVDKNGETPWCFR